MKYLLVLILLSGCSTTVRDARGVTRFRTFSDITNLDYQDETTKIHADRLDNSTPTKAGTDGIADGLTSAAAAGIIGIK